MKKTLSTLFILLLMFNYLLAQTPQKNIVGIWEVNEYQFEAWPMNMFVPVDNFPNKIKFFEDGTFSSANFYQSGSNNTERILKMGGDFKITNDSLLLVFKNETCLTANCVEFDKRTVERIKERPLVYKLSFKYSDKNGIKSVAFKDHVYYQVSPNPNIKAE